MPIVLLLIVIAVVAYVWIDRSRELFYIRLSQGKLSVVRGTVPPGLLSSFREAIGDAREGKIRAHRTPNGARLSASGEIDEASEQRLRNVLGLYPMSKLSARPIDKRQVANDALTVHWLLRLFLRR